MTVRWYKVKPQPVVKVHAGNKYSKPVKRYYRYRSELEALDITVAPGDSIVFLIPSSKSWSKKEKEEKLYQRHEYKPDLDNLIKPILDASHKEDSFIWQLGVTMKVWSPEGEGAIVIIPNNAEASRKRLLKKIGVLE